MPNCIINMVNGNAGSDNGIDANFLSRHAWSPIPDLNEKKASVLTPQFITKRLPWSSLTWSSLWFLNVPKFDSHVDHLGLTCSGSDADAFSRKWACMLCTTVPVLLSGAFSALHKRCLTSPSWVEMNYNNCKCLCNLNKLLCSESKEWIWGPVLLFVLLQLSDIGFSTTHLNTNLFFVLFSSKMSSFGIRTTLKLAFWMQLEEGEKITFSAVCFIHIYLVRVIRSNGPSLQEMKVRRPVSQATTTNLGLFCWNLTVCGRWIVFNIFPLKCVRHLYVACPESKRFAVIKPASLLGCISTGLAHLKNEYFCHFNSWIHFDHSTVALTHVYGIFMSPTWLLANYTWFLLAFFILLFPKWQISGNYD